MTVRLGVDSGSAHLALAVTEGDTLPLRRVDSHTIDVGRRVPLDIPRTFIDKRGISRTYLDKYQPPSDTDVKSYALEVVAFAQEHGVTDAIVEEVRNTHFDGSRKLSGMAAQSDALAITAKIGIVIALELADAGIKVRRVSHATWAGRVAHGANVKPKQVRSVIGLAVLGAEYFANEHERDAAGCCAWDCVVAIEGPHAPRKKPAPKPRKTRAPKEPRAPKVTAAKQARIDAGCVCGNRRHRMTCALFGKGVGSQVRSDYVRKTGRDEKQAARNASYRYKRAIAGLVTGLEGSGADITVRVDAPVDWNALLGPDEPTLS